MTTVESPRAPRTPRAGLDERILGAGTNARFGLLLLLIVAAGGYLPVPVLQTLHTGDYNGCVWAAGADFDPAHQIASAAREIGQALAFLPCVAHYAPRPPLWELLVGPVVVVAAAALATVLLPLWKQRRRRCVRLRLVAGGPEVAAHVGELAAGRIGKLPELFVAPAVLTRSASVFGTNRRPRLLLNGGLVACRTTDPRTFDAVVLHELGHIANRDLTATYGTITLWRSFLALVTVPYLLWWSGLGLFGLPRGAGPAFTPFELRNLAVPVVVGLVMYLVRADVLRSRELHADLTADRWGAPLAHVWATRSAQAGHPYGDRPGVSGLLHRIRHHHPRWDVRRDALHDPEPLFTVSPLLMLLLGTSATLMNLHLMGYVSADVSRLSDWLGQGLAAAPAAMVAAATATVLWRATARAAALGRRPPTGVRPGIWLGLGLAAGSLLSGQSSMGQWLPGSPGLLVLSVAAGVAFTCWTTQCARLATASWPGRTLRWPLALCLTGGWLILSAWFAWWNYFGSLYAVGFWYELDGVLQNLANAFPGPGTVDPDTGTAVAATYAVLRNVAYQPLAPLASVAAWTVPLVLWARGATGGRPGWLRPSAAAVPAGTAADAPAAGSLPLPRQALVPALLGTAVTAEAVVAVQAWLHAVHAAPGQRGGLYAVSYAVWALWAIAAGAFVAALIAAATPRFRLLTAFVAAGICALLGLAAATALMSFDGCVEPLSVLNDGCAWRPAWQQLENGGIFGFIVHSALTLAPAIAVAATAPVALLRAARRAGLTVAAGPATVVSAPWTRRRYVTTVLPAIAAPIPALALVAVLMVGDAHVQLTPKARLMSVTAQAEFQRAAGLPLLAVPEEIHWRQVHAWYRLGGRYLFEHAHTNMATMARLARPQVRGDHIEVTTELMTAMRPVCQNTFNVTTWEPVYFQIPDQVAQTAWHQFALTAGAAGRACLQAVDRHDTAAFHAAMLDLLTAARDVRTASDRVKAIIDDPADPVYEGRPTQPLQPRL
ncbi:M56 family metallopeptidase [Streptomyces sp. NPDC002734]|uniref:M56 family metallopeptidase n=1 Tax=Streptomyces sp. NPDC002734 TaxID=3154426 RepID=UPI00332CDC03